ncbi:hypothetical protein A2382_02870 [Candidatus Woesebacteria bacterium RIFOXYB1_FULL_38_16]|uniref:Uncharacterized protein n=1 Tax=Candidatus Woesebacteria bacterium RIFOXYB1_FULL_38_16 TaxID=1802538 RepID=A0A1F8CS30_9BACT|nr:MAG: hypothetical protein A2191_04715 [Candidatus Woesebacteria bacterium RIFOXYA1_FULL_38_9]OGM79153.1 MAG: hypothetical protein A2382_02870 [Candidatus Woesebacteria bacterium RIFOXYB1_FULL_38_16]
MEMLCVANPCRAALVDDTPVKGVLRKVFGYGFSISTSQIYFLSYIYHFLEAKCFCLRVAIGFRT